MRTTPFDDIDRLFERMNRRFAEFDSNLGEMDRWSAPMGGIRGISMDVANYDEEIVVVADLPGFEKENIDLSVTDDSLTVKATRESDEESESDAYVRRERSSESVQRSISLPAMVDADATSASYNNGVLTVTLPKLEKGEGSHRIDID